MTGNLASLLAAALAGLAVLVAQDGGSSTRRVRRLSGHGPAVRSVTALPGMGADTRAGSPPRLGAITAVELSSQPAQRAAAALGGVGLALVVGMPVGAVAGAAAAVGLARFLASLEPAAVRRTRERLTADLPIAADLLVAGVCAGAPLDDVAAAVAEAVGGPLGVGVRRVIATTRLGGDPVTAWSGLADAVAVAGGDRASRGAGGGRHSSATGGGTGGSGITGAVADASFGRVLSHAGVSAFGRAVARALGSGAPLAPALMRIAEDQRARQRSAAELAARRVGVRAVGPLALCFLPAFVVIGIVPVVAAVAGSVVAPLR